uniref:Uncharacterized protein n=1 Tax=Hyaloperonospora arabidopsidis (strain Emoy2) TaxID=559515 RepID=M4B663_HYAAE
MMHHMILGSNYGGCMIRGIGRFPRLKSGQLVHCRARSDKYGDEQVEYFYWHA